MNNIFITDGQNGTFLDHINKKHVISNVHEKDIPSNLETFNFTVIGDIRYAKLLGNRNGIIIPCEDGNMLEFRIFETFGYRDSEGHKVEVYSSASYLDLKTAKIMDPGVPVNDTAEEHIKAALNGTNIEMGNIDFKGTRTINFDSPKNPYDYIKEVAEAFDMEIRFYVTNDGTKITGRYLDLVDSLGEWRGRTVEFGRDLKRIERIEKTDGVVTALWAYGPVREDGTRLKTLVEDNDSRLRWGINGRHLYDYFEPVSGGPDMTKSELETLANIELEKRNKEVVTYRANVIDLEMVPGIDNKAIRFGDTIRVKDTKYEPALYLEARIFNQKRDVFNNSSKQVTFGDFEQFTEDEIRAAFLKLQEEIRKRMENFIDLTMTSSAGIIFKNTEGETTLKVRTFLSGNEIDEDGSHYTYKWFKFDRNGVIDPQFSHTGKTLLVNANDIDGVATYRVEVSLDHVIGVVDITLADVVDGAYGDGEIIEKSVSPPSNPPLHQLWLDISTVPNILRRWDGTGWVDATATEAEQIGAFPKEDGDSLADTVQTIVVDTTEISSDVETLFSQKADVEDLSGLATGEELSGAMDTVNDYVDSRVNYVEDEVNRVTSSLEKTAQDIRMEFTSSSGVNLLRNSIGFAGTDFWTANGTIDTRRDSEIEAIGYGSGWFSPRGSSGYLEQTFFTPVDETYTISFLLNKTMDALADSDAVVEIVSNNVVTAKIGKPTAQGITNGYEVAIYTFKATHGTTTVRIKIDEYAEATITGLMLNKGSQAFAWNHHPEEIYNTNITFNQLGIRVKNENTDGYTIMSPEEFSGYGTVDGQIQRIFTLNGATTEVEQIKARTEINMPPIKIRTIDTSSRKGWAFIPSE